MIIYKRRQEAKQKRREKRAERRAKRQAKREVTWWTRTWTWTFFLPISVRFLCGVCIGSSPPNPPGPFVGYSSRTWMNEYHFVLNVVTLVSVSPLCRGGHRGQLSSSLDYRCSLWRKRPVSGGARTWMGKLQTKRSRRGLRERTGPCSSSRPLLKPRTATLGGSTWKEVIKTAPA